MPEELLTIIDETLTPLYPASREKAHQEGLLHQVVHCWVVSRDDRGVRLWFQQRAHSKTDFPDYYDIAVGGHIDAGESPEEAVFREMREEIGIQADPNCLRYLGYVREELKIGDFFDREVGHVYLYEDPSPQFAPGEEVDRMVWLSLPEMLRKESGCPATAYGQDGQAVQILPGEWCVHPGEFEQVVLPALGQGSSFLRQEKYHPGKECMST